MPPHFPHQLYRYYYMISTVSHYFHCSLPSVVHVLQSGWRWDLLCISLLHLRPAASRLPGTGHQPDQLPPQPQFVQGYEIFAFGTSQENRVDSRYLQPPSDSKIAGRAKTSDDYPDKTICFNNLIRDFYCFLIMSNKKVNKN